MISNSAQRLLQYGISPSVQRIAIMEYLMTHRVHPTVDDIYNDLVKEIPTLSRTTVYNTLKLMVERGVALQLNIDERNQHFDGDIFPHAHFLCRKCGRIYDLPIPTPQFLHLDKKDEFVVEECQIYYKGCCPVCKNELNNRNR